MFPARYAWLLWSLLPGFSVQENSDSPKDHKTIDKNARQIESRSITLEEARAALNRLVQNHSFLSDAPFLEPLKTRIKRENEKELLLRVPSGSAYQGFSLGYWYCNPTNNDFSYLAKSSSRTELYTIRGHFFLSEDKHWIAKITEASRTSLFNAFGKQEYEQIKPTMTLNDVIKILGTPPGVFFAAEATFLYPGGRRFLPFTGTGKEFQQAHPWFFVSKPDSRSRAWINRAWISNDIAIWVTFDEDGKVHGKTFTEVRLPNEETELSKALLELLKNMRKRKQ